jgi:hypothetical protein
MLALWFIVSAAAISPRLHHWLHKDSNSPKHECAITNVAKGSLLVGCSSVTTAAAPLPVFAYLSCCTIQHFSAFDHRVSSSRAPPSVSSPITVVG